MILSLVIGKNFTFCYRNIILLFVIEILLFVIEKYFTSLKIVSMAHIPERGITLIHPYFPGINLTKGMF